MASRIDARETLEVTARDGILVQYPAGLDLDGTIEVFGDTPALAWMQTLRARDDVDWQAMNEVYREWDHESSGLSAPAAAVVAIAVTVATKGLGNQFAVGVLGFAEGSAAALADCRRFAGRTAQANHGHTVVDPLIQEHGPTVCRKTFNSRSHRLKTNMRMKMNTIVNHEFEPLGVYNGSVSWENALETRLAVQPPMLFTPRTHRLQNRYQCVSRWG